MPDSRPISERIDLTYVRRNHWPRNTASLLALGLVGAVGAWVVAGSVVSGDHGAFSSGSMTRAHAMFADNCAACHQPAATPSALGATFWLPVQDDACLACHLGAAAAHHPDQSAFLGPARDLPGSVDPVPMSANCAHCHVEHRGPDHDLNQVDDRVCTSCHASLKANGFKAAATGLACAMASHAGIVRGPRGAVLPPSHADSAPGGRP